MIRVHIGRHKTGTSALQWFLHDNRKRLAKAGYVYPEPADGRLAHHALAVWLNDRRRHTLSPEALAQGEADAESLRRSAGTGANVLLSSEAFQNIDPSALRALLDGREAEIIVYLREPLDYLISSYAQMIQARAETTPFVDYARGFRADYRAFLDRWAETLGREALKVRLYDRAHLVEGDVRRDFLEVLGLAGRKFRFRERLANPSLGPDLIEFKGMVNRHVPLDQQQRLRLYNHLARITGRFPRRLMVSPAFQERFRARWRQANSDALAAYAGIAGGFDERDFSGQEEPVDLREVRTAALEALSEVAKRSAKTLRKVLPEQLEDEPRLLPADWAAAAAAL